MESPRGTIVALSGDRAVVEVAAAACPRCASGRGCGAGILTGRRGLRRVEARIAPGVDVATGDPVSVEIPPADLLNAALVAYGLPLLGGAAGATLGFVTGAGDAGTAVLAGVGILCGFAIGRRRLSRSACLSGLTPVVSRRLDAGDAASG